MASKVIVFTNARVFSPSKNGDTGESHFLECMVVQGQKIDHVGKEDDEIVQKAIKNGAEVIDVKGRVITPSFIDSHTHLLFFGLSLQKLDLSLCVSLASIRNTISEYAIANPRLPRLLCRGWFQPAAEGKALASLLDDLDPRPIYVESKDLHSTWCNTSALKELPIDEIKEKCGDDIACDADGRPTGLLAESAQTAYIWPHLVTVATSDEKFNALEQAFQAYVEAGYTGIIDMAMDSDAWETIIQYRNRKAMPLHLAAHWFLRPGLSLDEVHMYVDEAIAMNREWNPETSPEFCVVGIKMMADGVVDGCTASLSHPYGGMTDLVKPFWSSQVMEIAIKKAASAGLQCAIHAIGDAAVTQAINSIAAANTPNGRHRIEHLELTTVEDAKRLGQLGITASVQPVHSDPHICKAYAEMIGPESWKRAFAYKEFLDGDACVAFGTDAPTAEHLPLPNLYNATTRRSALDPGSEVMTNPHNALTLSQSLVAATASGAYSRFAETWTGSLRSGMRADFVVLDTSWTPETLLEAKIHQTWCKGELLFDSKQ